MATSEPPKTSESDAIADLNRKLSVMRHNINNHLALVVAASELIRRKPEMAPRLVENILQQPDRINAEIRGFSDAFALALRTRPDHPLSAQAAPPPSYS
jgi:hypothetical protein